MAEEPHAPAPLVWDPTSGTTLSETIHAWFKEQRGLSELGQLVVGPETVVLDLPADDNAMLDAVNFLSAEVFAIKAAVQVLASAVDRSLGL